MTDAIDPATSQTVPVYQASDFAVSEGVAKSEGISFADDLVMDDIYVLSPQAKRLPLTLTANAQTPGFSVMPQSDLGHEGNAVVLDCCITLMAPDSTTYEALVLVEVEGGGVEAVYLLPLATLRPEMGYRLVGVDRHAATARFAEVACVSFTKGTHITMASGLQVPIEDLNVGDKILTRDDGPQPIRWIGQTTLRAVGEFAPVVITKGTLHNENDLIVSPDHRLFVYQRQDRLGAGRSEVLVKVRHLINGTSVRVLDGGFVDYYQLLFDDHQFVFAEGIAAESLLIDPRTSAAIPEDVRRSGGAVGREHAHRAHQDYEVQEQLLSQPDAVELLRKASST